MNLRERLELRAIINMVIGIIERLVSLFDKASAKFTPKPKIDTPEEPVKPHRPKPLKKVVDTIDNIIPLPWRDNNE
jgi:hypothetical protein